MVVSKADNFRSIFNWTGNDIEVKGITIPIVQRDYAQGRKTPDVNRIRSRFLQVLYDALVEGKNTTLDFIYGNVDAKGQLIPLDGQQRLTTLFLLHYYIARHEDIAEEEFSFLLNFTYETRVSSREFCGRLVKYMPDFSLATLSEQIQDEAWFLLEWESDPTVLSMLVMLDAIHSKFKETNGLWNKLMGDAITFYFLPLDKMGITDELYIKMNSRGKPLTRFEHFKAELELQIKAVNEDLAKQIVSKIDKEWSDLLWPYRNSDTDDEQADMVTDDEFLRYIHFVSDLISYRNDELEIKDEFEIIEKQFSKGNPKAEENILLLENLFDIWTKISDINSFFNDYFTLTDYAPGKTKIDKQANLFQDCCAHYGIIIGKRPQFPLGRFILLYCFILKLQHQEIEDADFRRRLRIVNNLVNNSVNTLRSDFMKELLLQVDKIIISGIVEQVEEGKARFQSRQMEEEKKKLQWISEHPGMSETLFRLEDHPYLNGYIKAVGLNNLAVHNDWCDRFYSLFSCNLHLVNKALLSVGDYFEKDAWRYHIGIGDFETNKNVRNRMWQELFSPITLEDSLCNVLQQLLSERETFDDDYLKERIDKYMQDAQEFPLRYYIIKYESMRTNKDGRYNNYGKYYWRHHNDWPKKDDAKQREMRLRDYNVLLMSTEWSTGGYNHDIFLKTLYDLRGKESRGLELENYSYTRYNQGVDKLRLNSQKMYLTLVDNVYRVYNDEEDQLIDSRIIVQNDNGIDTEDRVEVGLSLLDKYLK